MLVKKEDGFYVSVKQKQIFLENDYHPLNDKDEYMNIKQLAYFKKVLLNWIEELGQKTKETLDNLSEEFFDKKSIEEIDAATDEVEILTQLRSRDRYRKLIHKIEEAITRIETGDYGYCEKSGEEIGLMRLLARPTAAFCIAEQQKHENEEDRQDHYVSNYGIIQQTKEDGLSLHDINHTEEDKEDELEN